MNNLTTIDQETGEVLSGLVTELPIVEQGAINMQIATARRFPRSLRLVTSRMHDLVTLDEDSAEECIYALPRGGKPIKGPSIRFAEALKQAFGNCRAVSRITEINRVEKYVEAEGIFLDLETNTATSMRVRRRIVDRNGKLYNDDMIVVTGNAACSIAMRNAILGGIPKPIWRGAYETVSRVVSGDITTLAENRDKAIKHFAAFGVKPEQIFKALGVNGVEDITVDHVGTLRGMFATLKNGESTVEEMFASPTAEKKADPDYNPLDRAKDSEKPKTEPKADAKPKADPEKDGDPIEAERAGRKAFHAGDPREAPEDYTEGDKEAWLGGYDAEASAASEGEA